MSENRPQVPPRTMLALIFGGLLLWGLFVAGGVLWNGVGTFNLLGAAVVMVCVGIFLGFWLLLLRTQNRKDRPR